jgi:hypothetical protein
MDNFNLKKYLAEGKLAERKLNEGKTDALRNLLEKVYEDAIENVEYDEMYGYSSKSFNEYWNENRGEITAMFSRI